MSTLLELKNINLTYQTLNSETEAIKNVSFTINQGEFVSIVGPSGSGKTTILSLIAGLLKASSGEILLDGEQVNGISTNVGYMFQRDNLFEWLSVHDNISIGLKINHKKRQKSKKQKKKIVKQSSFPTIKPLS